MSAVGRAFRVGVMVSGEGTNLQALLDTVHGREGVEVAAVAASRAGIPALDRAARAGVEAAVFALEDHSGREARDAAVAGWLASREVDLVVLAGWMQLLTPGFLERFPGRVINVHPALLPAFAGLNAIEQAVAYGVTVFGVTVHFVDEGVDSGPIILQRAIELRGPRDAATVRAALRPLEHALLPEAVRLIARGAVRIDPEQPRNVLVDGGADG